MIPPRFIACIRSFLAALCALGLVSSVGAETTGAWEVKQIDGRDYVSADSMKKFYGFEKLTRNDKSVVLENPKVEMKLTIGGEDCFMNGVKFVFSNVVEESDGKVYVSRMDLAKLIDPVLRPNFIQNAGDFTTVILDSGHGGKDSGAANSIGTEAVYNLSVAKRLKTLLQSQGYKVIMTREDNTFLSLQERVDVANAVKESAIFVSIHFNSGGSQARGIETFTLSPPGVAHYGRGLVASDNRERLGNEHDSANIALATSVHGTVLRKLEKYTIDRGIKRARFSVLSGVEHPAILLEGGFMTHPYEARLIDNEAYRNTIAASIAEAIAKYRYAVGGRKAVTPRG